MYARSCLPELSCSQPAGLEKLYKLLRIVEMPPADYIKRVLLPDCHTRPPAEQMDVLDFVVTNSNTFQTDRESLELLGTLPCLPCSGTLCP